MADGFEIPVRVVVEDGNLSQLENRLKALQEAFKTTPKMRVDSSEATAVVNDMISAIKRVSGTNVKINVDTTHFKSQVNQMDRMLQQLKAAAAVGIDSKQLFSSKAFDKEGIKFSSMQKTLSNALKRQQAMLQKTMEGLSLSDTGLNRSDHINYVIGAMEQITNYARTAGLQLKTLGDGSLQFTKTMNGVATSIQTFDKNGKSSVKVLQNLEESFTTAQKAADAFNKIDTKDRSNMFKAIQDEYAKLGKTLKSEDLSQYITKFSSTIDEQGRVVKAKVETMVDGIRTAFNFKGATDENGQHLLLFKGIDTTVTNNIKLFGQLKSTLTEAANAYKQWLDATNKGDKGAASDARARYDALMQQSNAIKNLMTNQELLNKAVDSFDKKMLTINTKQMDLNARAGDKEKATTVVQALSEIEKAYQKLNTLKLKGGSEAELGALRSKITQNCDAINQALGKTAIKFNETHDTFARSNVNIEKIFGSTDQIERVTNSFKKFDEVRKSIADINNAKMTDMNAAKDLDTLNSKYNQIIQKMREYNQAKAAGNDNVANKIQGEITQLEDEVRSLLRASATWKTYSQDVRDARDKLTTNFETNKQTVTDEGKLQELESIYNKIIAKKKEYDKAMSEGNVNVANAINDDITKLTASAQKLEAELEKSTTVIERYRDLRQRFSNQEGELVKTRTQNEDITKVNDIINKYEQLFQLQEKIGKLKFVPGNEQEVTRLQGEIENIIKSLGDAGTTYDKVTNTFSKPIDIKGITDLVVKTNEGKDAFKAAAEAINQTMTEMNVAQGNNQLQQLSKLYDQIIAKYKEYYQAKSAGNENVANRALAEAKGYESIAKSMEQSIQKSKEFSQATKELASSMKSAFYDNKQKLFNTADLQQLASVYDQIIQKTREFNAAQLRGDTSTASGIQDEITKLKDEATQLEQNIQRRKGALEQLKDLRNQFNQTMSQVGKENDIAKDLQEVDQTIQKYEELFRLQEKIGQLRFKTGAEGEVTRLQGELQTLLKSLEGTSDAYNAATNTFSKPFKFTAFDNINVKANEAKDAIQKAKTSIDQIMTEGNAKQNNAQEIHNVQELIKVYDQIIAKRKEYLRAKNAGDTNTAAAIKQELSALQQLRSGLESSLKGTQALADAQKYLKQEMNAVTAKQTDTTSHATLKGYEAQIKQMEQIMSKLQSLRAQTGKTQTSNQLLVYGQQLDQLVQKFEQFGVKFDNVKQKLTVNTSSLDSTAITNLSKSLGMSVTDVEKLIEALNQLQTRTNALNAKGLDTAYQQASDAALKKLDEIKQKEMELAKTDWTKKSASELEKLQQEITQLANEYQKLLRVKVTNNGDTHKLGRDSQYIEQETQAIKNRNKAIQETSPAITKANNGLDTMIGRLARMASSYLIFMNLQRAIYGSITAVKELDSAMTSLQIVTEKSDAQIQRMTSNYASMAKELGVTLQSVMEGSEEWLRQGFSESQTEELLRASTMLSTVGNMEAAQSTEALTSILNGFNMEASQATMVIDTLNQLDLKYATSAQELATAMQRVSSVAKTAGMDFQELASVITVVSSNTRLSAETIGNGIKSLLSRLQNIKVGKYLDDNNEALNDTEKVLNSLGVTLRDSATEWREPMKILEDVGNMWDNLTDIDKSAIATALGGTYQRNTLMSILENWDEVDEAMNVAADSAGSTAQKYEAYMDSLEAKLNQLKTVWSEFLLNMNLSGVAGNFINAVTGIVSFLDQIINKTPLGTAAITALTMALIRFSVIKLANVATGIIKFVSALPKAAAGASIFARMLNPVKNLANGLRGATVAATTTAAATEATGVAAFSAAGGFSALLSSLAALVPYIAIIVGIGVAIAGIGKLIDEAFLTDKELAERIDTTKGNIEEIQNTIDGYNQKLDENKQRLEEINALKGTSNWTSELATESAEIERQNTLLERKIALEERKKAIENRALAKDTNEQFERDAYNMGANHRPTSQAGNLEYNNANTDNERAIAAYREMVRINNEQVQAAIDAQNEYLQVCEQTEVGDKKREKALKKVNQAMEAQRTTEEWLFNTNEKLHENYETLQGDNKTTADTIDQLNDSVAVLDESMASGQIVTFGDTLTDTADAVENVISPVEKLQSTIEKLGDVDITPVNSEFEDMGDYLRSLDASTIEELQFILDNLGDSADEFVVLLSTMDSATQIDFINDRFKEFKGTLDDCTAAYSEFKKLAESDPSAEMTGVAELMQYLEDEKQYGIERWDMHNKALEGLGISNSADWRAEIENMKASVADLYDSASYTIKGTTTDINDSQEAISQFGADLIRVIREGDGAVGKFEDTTRTISDITEKELFEAFNADRLERGLTPISDILFSGFMEDAKRYLSTDFSPPIDKLQQSYRDLKDTASDAWSTLEESLSDIDMTKIDVPVGVNKVTFSPEEKNRIVEAVNTAIEDINSGLGTSGLKVEIPKIDAHCTDIEVRDSYRLVNNVQTQLNKLFDGNNFNIEPIKSIAQKVNEQFNNQDIQIDGNKITFKTSNARERFVTALENEFKGINIASILTAAMNNGEQSLNFDFDGAINTEAFAGELQTQLQTAVSGMQLTMEGVAFDTTGLQANIKAVGTSAEDAKKVVVDSIQEAINTINASNTSACQLSISKIGDAASGANGKVINLKSTIDTLKSKSITITVDYVERNKPANISGGSTKAKEPAANGTVPGYAVGKRKSDGMSMPMRASEYANAMVGEEGIELKIDKDGKQEMVGMNGPELIHVKPGDTIVPHNVTDMITKGKIKQHYDGTTMNVNRYHSKAQNSNSSGSSSSSSSSKSSGSSSSKSSGSSSSSRSSGSSRSSSSSSSSSSKSSKSTKEEKQETTIPEAEEAIKKLDHLLAMEQITQEEYTERYRKIWQQYYKDIAQYRDKDWEMQEKIFEDEKDALEKQVELLEHELTMAEYHNASADERIAILKAQQDIQHQIAEESRARAGGAETDDSRAAAEEWWKLQKDIEDIEDEIWEDYEARMEHQIDLLDRQKEKVSQEGTELYNKYKGIYNNYSKLVDEATNLGTNLDQVIYGNVNLNSNQIVEWTDETLGRYKSALESWGRDLGSMKGTMSQALGETNTYDDVEISFNALLQTDTGAEVLSKSTVNKYITRLLDNAGEGWTEEILFDLDAQGLEVDGKKIQNILVDIGSQADKTARSMELSGSYGEVAQALRKVQDAAYEAGVSVDVLMSKLDVQARRGSNMENVTAQKIAALKQHQADLHTKAEGVRKAKGVTDNEETRGYSDQWWDDYDAIMDAEEELYQFRQDNRQHEIDQLSHQKNTELQRMEILSEMETKAHERAEALRKAGYSDESEAIRQLQDDWWSYEEERRELEKSIHDDFMTDRQHEIDMLAAKSGTEQKQLRKYGEMAENIEERIATLKQRGYTEEDEELQEVMQERVSNEQAMDDLREKMYQNQVKRHQHTINNLQRESDTEGRQILELMAMQELAYSKVAYLREQGFSETSDEMMDLAEEIWGYSDQIQDLINQAFDSQMNEISRSIEELNDDYDRIELAQADVGEGLDAYVKRVNSTNKERLATEEKILRAYKTQYISIMYEVDRLSAENAEANKDRIDQLKDQARSIANTIRQEAEKMKQAALEEQQAIQTHQESIIAGLQSFTQDMIDDLEEQNDLIQEKIDLLEEEMDKEDELLKEQELKKKLEDATLDLEKKKEALEKTKNNRVKRVYYAERGWVWETDKEAVQDASDAVDDATESYEDAKKALEDFYKQQQIDAWKKEIEANNKKIQSYNDYIQKLGQVSKQYEDHVNRMNAAAWLGVKTQGDAYDQLIAGSQAAKEAQAIIQKDMEDNLGLTIQNATGYLETLRDTYYDTAENIKEIELTSIEAWEEALTRSLDNVEAQANRAVELVNKVKEQSRSDYDTGKNYNYDTGTYGKPTTSTSNKKPSTSTNKTPTRAPTVLQADGHGNAPKDAIVGDYITTHGGTFKITGGSAATGWKSERIDYAPSYATPGSNTKDWYYNVHKAVQAVNGKAPPGLKVGDICTTHGGSYVIKKVKADGTYVNTQTSKIPCYATPGSNTTAWYRQNVDKGFSTGGIVDFTGPANVHGSETHSEVIFNSSDAKKLWDMIHTYNPDIALADNTSAVYSRMNATLKGINNTVHDTGTTINISTVNLPSVQQPNDFVRRLKTISLNRKG